MGKYSKIKIAYYSGTGGSALAAWNFSEKLEEKGCLARLEKITNAPGEDCDDFDLLILIFPVHAFNAPAGVYKWIKSLKAVNGIDAAVIAVSGGGGGFPQYGFPPKEYKKTGRQGL